MLPLLEVLQAKSTVESKLKQGGCGEKGVTKPDVRGLVQEVATKLCAA
jgi:desumoylating isopeptidase 1